MHADEYGKHVDKSCVLCIYRLLSPEDSQATLEQNLHRTSLSTHLQQTAGGSAAHQPPQHR